MCMEKDFSTDKEYLEKDLPLYLQISIDELKKNMDNEKRIDLYLDDLYGSINSAWADGEISERQAWYLREKYLGLSKEG